jgi:hypothetical protein
VDGARKMLLGAFTCRAAVHVYNSRNVFVCHNVMPVRYLRGGDAGRDAFFDPFSQKDRTSLRRGIIPDGKAVFAVPLYPNEKIAGRIDILGRFRTEANPNPSESAPALHYRMAEVIAHHWGWKIRYDYHCTDYYSTDQAFGTVCSKGHMRIYASDGERPKRHGRFVVSNSHFGPHRYPGFVKDFVAKSGNNNQVVPKNWALEGNASSVS